MRTVDTFLTREWWFSNPIWRWTQWRLASTFIIFGQTDMSTATLERNPVPPVVAPPPQTSTLVIVAFGLVYVVWGSTYLAIRVGIESFPPLLLAGSRHLLTGLILYPILRWKTGVRPTPAHWRVSFITGFLLLGVGNGGVCLAERTVPSGVTALLVATGRRPAWRSRSRRIHAWIRRVSAFGRAEESRRVGSRRSVWGRSAINC